MTERHITPKIRFETFKRDGFTCRYCGRKTPQVVLEVDHVVPVAEGGTDDPENLVTSCFECNRGKGATLLESLAPGVDIHEQTVLLLERDLQLREYNAVKAKQREREDGDIADLYDFWDSIAPGGKAGKLPFEHILRKWLRVFAAEDIKDAMEIAMRQKGSWTGAKYLSGILRNWANQRGIEAGDDEVG